MLFRVHSSYDQYSSITVVHKALMQEGGFPDQSQLKRETSSQINLSSNHINKKTQSLPFADHVEVQHFYNIFHRSYLMKKKLKKGSLTNFDHPKYTVLTVPQNDPLVFSPTHVCNRTVQDLCMEKTLTYPCGFHGKGNLSFESFFL